MKLVAFARASMKLRVDKSWVSSFDSSAWVILVVSIIWKILGKLVVLLVACGLSVLVALYRLLWDNWRMR